MPASDPAGVKPVVLTDAEHAKWDPNHTQACELLEMNGGAMDAYGGGAGDAGIVGGTVCASPENVATADPAIIKPYWDLAARGALADRYFQPVAGESSSNDMYLARAQYVFRDNDDSPKGAVGVTCDVELGAPAQFTDTTIGDLLTAASVPWAWFSEGYAALQAANGGCPPKPSDCAFQFTFYPCTTEPADVPFEYFASTVDNAATMKDLSAFTSALGGQGELPAVSFVKGIGYKQEHPGKSSTLSAGVTFVSGVVAQIEASRYASDTLVLLVYDEGGGYFDHVAPPGVGPVDGQPYGTRVPMLALGPFARTNFVSHAMMEHSSIVKFIEWNWLGQKTGQLAGRDAVVANLGSLLDPSATGVAVPAN
jgi:phospholipase C